jgi:hypothetical protein
MDTVASVPHEVSSHQIEASASGLPQSPLSWSAIIAGAIAAIAIALVVVTLAAGLGLTSISPWPNSGASAVTFTISAGIALIIVHWIASAGGGFIAGRLRTSWIGVHAHEAFFRDTAHGFLSWALASLIGTMFIASAFSSVVSGGAHAVASVASGAAQGVGQTASVLTLQNSGGQVSGYDIDRLFRSDHPDQNGNEQSLHTAAARIVGAGLTTGDVPAGDRTYLTQMVATQTGVSQAEAEGRVSDVIARAQAAHTKALAAADAARKAAMEFAIFTALAMVVGAFIASAAAAYGGSIRFGEEREVMPNALSTAH